MRNLLTREWHLLNEREIILFNLRWRKINSIFVLYMLHHHGSVEIEKATLCYVMDSEKLEPFIILGSQFESI